MNINQIEKKIELLEKSSTRLELNEEERRSDFSEFYNYSEDFLNKVNNLPAFVPDYEGKENFDKYPFAEKGTSPKDIIDFMSENVDRAGINPASGGHIGYIPGGGIYSAAMGDYLAAAMNRYSGVFYASPGAVRIENQIIDWVADLIGYQDGYGGNLASGGSMANLIAIAAARKAKNLKSRQIDISVVYITQQVHHCVTKALRVLGMDEIIIRSVPMDENYKMKASSLDELVANDKEQGLNPFLVVGSAGSTDVGAIDPIAEIADVSEKHNLWFHVDGAYGGFFLLSDEVKGKFEGIERADSVILDPHKGLFLPYGVGVVMVKDINHLLEANSYDANYMQDTRDHRQEYSPADLSPELSRHFRGLRMWLPLKLHGIEPFRYCLEEKIWLTRYFFEKVQELGLEVGPEPELSVAAFRFNHPDIDNNEVNKKLLQKIHNDGRVFISSTTLEGQFWMRIAVLSFRTRKWHLDVILELLEEGLAELNLTQS